MEEFHVSQTVATLNITLYTLGIGIGPIFTAPLSEILGRKWTFVITSLFLLSFTAGAGGAKNYATFLVCRLLAGFLGSAGIAVGGGAMTDIWGVGREGSLAALTFIFSPFLGPTLGPLVGAYILNDHGDNWRWTIWITVMIGAPAFLGFIFTSETSKSKILNEHSKGKTSREILNGILQFAFVRVTKMLLTEVIVFSLTLYTSFTYAVVFSFFASSPYVLGTDYGFDSSLAGLSLISVIIGYFFAAFMFLMFHATVYERATTAAGGMAAPEHRLYAGMVGSIFLPMGLFW